MTVSIDTIGGRGDVSRRLRRAVDTARHSNQLPLTILAVGAFFGLAVWTGFDTLSAGTLDAYFRFLAVPVVIGLSQLVVLSVGQLNLCVGALTGFCAMSAAWLVVRWDVPLWMALLVCLAIGTAVGLANGLLVVATRINGFVVTLGMLTVLEGLRYALNGTGTFQGWAHGLTKFSRHEVVRIPVIFVLALAVAGAIAVYFRSTVSGRRLLATGGNDVAANLSGISNDRSVVVAHTLSGLLVGVAAVLLVSNSDSVNQSIGDDLLLPSFAAPIIGGVMLSGGFITVSGTILAASLVRTIQLGQVKFEVNRRWVDLLIGVTVLVAVLVGQSRRTSEGRR
jgi:ribose transport system permease protein